MVSEALSSPATDGGPGIVNILMDLGPACTSNAGTFRDALRLITQKLPGGGKSSNSSSSSSGAIPLKEGGIARLIHFFAAVGARTKDGSSSIHNSDASLSSAFVGVLMNDTTDWNKADKTSPSDWNLDVVSQVLTDFSLSLHWPLVARSFDFPEFKVRDTRHLELLLALYSKASSGGKFSLPLEPIAGVGDWRNKEGQLTLLRALLIVTPSVYKFPLEEGEERKDAAAALVDIGNSSGGGTASPSLLSSSCPNPGGFACSKVLQRLLSLSDEPKLHQSAREVLGMGLQSCPEIILCALVRLQLSNAAAMNVADTPPQQLASIRARAQAGMPLKGELMRELIPLFFSPNPKWVVKNPTGAIRRLWEISPNTVVAACVEAFKVLPTAEERAEVVAFQCNLLRKSLPSADNGALQQVVSRSKDADFAYTLACYMADNGLLDFTNWLSERTNNVGKAAVTLQSIVFLTRTYNKAKLRSTAQGDGDSVKLVLSWENLASMLRMLTMVDNETMSQVIPNTDTTLGSQGKIILERCLQMYPNIATLTNFSSSNNANSPPNQPDEIEEAANAYFQKIYASEESAREVVEMLKRFKTSGSSRENDIFACMIHNLFDEYRFFSKYKELRITGILFGLLIKEQLVSSITLGIALRYVLEALRKPPNQSPQSGKMFRFGMFALEQFKERLHEWPQYCSHIVQIGHLREGYAALVGEIETAMDDNVTNETREILQLLSSIKSQNRNITLVNLSELWRGSTNKQHTKFLQTNLLSGYGGGSKLNKADVDQIMHSLVFENILEETAHGFTADYVQPGSEAQSVLTGRQVFVRFAKKQKQGPDKTATTKKKDDNNDNDTTSGQHQPLAAQMEQVENNYKTKCPHGFDIDRLSMADVICADFADAFQNIFHETRKDIRMKVKVPDCLQSAHNATLDRFADVWNDSAKMEIAISFYLSNGTQRILEGEYDHARDCAVFARYMEQYIAVVLHQTQAVMNWPKINEVYDADLHTLVKFFRKRIPCCCLDEKYEEVKDVTKMGYCYNSKCNLPRVERSKTMYCDRCRSVTYCSPECQEAHWSTHMPVCNTKAAVKAKFDTKQQNA